MVSHRPGQGVSGADEDGLEQNQAFVDLWQRTELKRAVATFLVRARKRAGRTQEDIAKRMGLGQPQVSRIESATGSIPELQTILRYLDACGTCLALASGRFAQPHALTSADAAVFFRGASDGIVEVTVEEVGSLAGQLLAPPRESGRRSGGVGSS